MSTIVFVLLWLTQQHTHTHERLALLFHKQFIQFFMQTWILIELARAHICDSNLFRVQFKYYYYTQIKRHANQQKEHEENTRTAHKFTTHNCLLLEI